MLFCVCRPAMTWKLTHQLRATVRDPCRMCLKHFFVLVQWQSFVCGFAGQLFVARSRTFFEAIDRLEPGRLVYPSVAFCSGSDWWFARPAWCAHLLVAVAL